MMENRLAVQQMETAMGVCRMLVILLCCVLSRATQVPQTNASNGVKLKPYCIGEKGHVVFVPCPNSTAHGKTYKLFKYQNPIHKCVFKNESTKTCETLNESKLGVQFITKEKLLGFEANVTSEAIYSCKAEVSYPPPFLEIQSDQLVIVHREGLCCQCNNTHSPANKENSQMILWIWSTVVAVLSTYSVAVTIVALIIWFKLKSADYQNDYMNTKPKPSGQRRNKNKVQNPIPRYF